MRLLCIALCLATIQIAVAQRKKKEPSVCDNAVIKMGVGFNPHPKDCTQFVQCYFYPDGRVEPVYRSCEYGWFWDQSKLKCLPAELVDCPNDKCKKGVKFYKHSDPNKCCAYWKCDKGKSYGQCCPQGEGFHPELGCVANPNCTDMCPFKDRVPGCNRRPVSGSPSRYEQYTDNGVWKREKCPKELAYNPADCECSIEGLLIAGKFCKPDVKINFNQGFKDVSGNNYKIKHRGVQRYKRAAYFNGKSQLWIEPLRPSTKDDGVLIVKLRYRERKGPRYNSLQTMFTNGHCNPKAAASVVVGKLPGLVLMGAEANYSRSFPLPTVEKPWKEIIYIHDGHKLEGRVCGATYNNWCVGPLKDTGCGLMFGGSVVKDRMQGYVGLMDDISIYRCKPMEAVININY